MNSWTKRGAAALATGILAASLTACGSSGGDGQDTGRPAAPAAPKHNADSGAKKDSATDSAKASAGGLKGVTSQMGAEYIRKGSRGYKVKCVQVAVNWFQSPNVSVDSIYGQQTANAVYRYQRAEHISRDGIVGPTTSRHLQSDVVNLRHTVIRMGENPRRFSTWLSTCPGVMP